MDGFFDKYGRVIIIAVVICFVLLFLTPMRNVVGSIINGFAGNFANKVEEILGTVKMPNGSGGATNSEAGKVGDTLDIEGIKYVVLEQKENNQALVMTASSIGEKEFQSKARSDGQNMNTYEGSEIDNYLENEWYDSLSPIMKAAIQPTNLKQTFYDLDEEQVEYHGYYYNVKEYETDYRGQAYNLINRHVFLPSLSEIGNLLGFPSMEENRQVIDNEAFNKIKAIFKGTSIWTRTGLSCKGTTAIYIRGTSGTPNGDFAHNSNGIRPTFVIDLSKVDYTVEEATNYK